MENPEIQFRTQYHPDYTGMTLLEYSYCQMEDYSGTQRDYSLDLITPDIHGQILPVVFFIHGGGFTEPCDKRQAYISIFARNLTKHGYAVVSPDYPLFKSATALENAGGEPAGYSKSSSAIHLAYRYIQEHAKEYGMDPNRISIIGGSAGGWAAFYAVTQFQDKYKAMINLWGVPRILPDLSSCPPLLSVHGTSDILVPYKREISLQNRLELSGIPHKLITLDGSGHTPLGKLNEFLPDMLAWLDRYMNE